MNKLFILSGASGVGKSTLLNRLVMDNFCIAVDKYTDRKKYNTLDHVIYVDNFIKSNLQCDLIYTMYGNNYGFCSNKIREKLDIQNLVLIVNDTKTIQNIKSMFPHRVIVIYIISDINENILREIYMKRYGVPSFKSLQSNILDKLEKSKEELLHNNVETFVNYYNEVNEMITSIFLEDKEFRLRAESLKQRATIFLNDFIYDFIVFNFFSKNQSILEATENAYKHLKNIITKESEDSYGECFK